MPHNPRDTFDQRNQDLNAPYLAHKENECILHSLFYLPELLPHAATQFPLNSNFYSKYHVAPEEDSSYTFKWPIKKVALIGAGPSGLVAHRELAEAGFDVYLYERDDKPGGNWYYTDEVPLPAPVPDAPAETADFIPDLPPNGATFPYTTEYAYHNGSQRLEEMRKDHRGPKPIWASLSSNSPAPSQRIREWAWPPGTEWGLPHVKLMRYLRSFASWHGINTNDNNPHVFYNTRVERVEKRYIASGAEAGWTLTLKQLVKTDAGVMRATWTQEDFDAVVVATGRFYAPSMPAIKGLDNVAAKFPDHISHSREYRRPEKYQNKKILIVGASVSGSEISGDLSQYASQIYQSFRPDKSSTSHFPLSWSLRRLPRNTTLVGEIKQFHTLGKHFNESLIELANGTVITGIDHIIFSTGFRFSYPFLPQFHNASLGAEDQVPRGAVQPLVTDGSHVRSLFLDLFYLDDPTLAFININSGIQTFTYGEFLSLIVAKVWSGKAKLPAHDEMWRYHEQVLSERGGYTKYLQYLGPERAQELLTYFQAWINASASKYGGKQIDGLPLDDGQIRTIWINAFFSDLSLGLVDLNSVGVGPESIHLGALDFKKAQWKRSTLEEVAFWDDW